MRVLLAQEFQIVRREVDHQQPPLRAQRARGFGDRARAVVEEVQHLMDQHDVEGILRHRQFVDVALAHAAMLQAGALQPRARERQHVERHVDAEPALDVGPEQFEHAAGAGAEIEQRTDRAVGERGLDRALDRRVGDMQAADAVPLGGVLAEIGLRGGGARGAHRGEPPAVAHHHRIGRIEPADQRLRDVGDAAALAEPIERPAPLAEAIDQAGFGEQLQMARDARLRLAQDFGEVGDRQLGFGEQREHAQARAFAGGAQRPRAGSRNRAAPDA